MSKSAQIVKIIDIINHENADSLEIAKVLGWNVITKKNEFSVGDLAVYIEIDSVVEERPEYEFLRNKNFRVRTIKLRGYISQGLLVPISILPKGNYEEGQDVSELAGASHYEKPLSANLSGNPKGNFPTSIISKTDEERIQNATWAFEFIKDKDVYASIKCDGSSQTVIHYEDGSFEVCSRNLILKEPEPQEKNTFWDMVYKYDLKNKLPKGYAIQAECVGEGIQKNRMGLNGQDLLVFNVKDLKTQKFLNYYDFKDFCDKCGLKTVPLYYLGKFKWNSIQEMLDEADKVVYPNGKIGEGIVWRLIENEYHPKLGKDFSVKTVSNKYLLKYEE